MDVILGIFFGIIGFFRDLFDPAKIYKLVETAITSWPLAVFASIIAVRSHLITLFQAIKSATYKDGSREIALNFSEGVSEIKEIIENSPEIQQNDKPEEEFKKLTELSKISRRSANIEAWLTVEEAAKNLLNATITTINTSDLNRGPPLIIERLLWQRGLITPTDREIISQLRKLRNEASHLREFQISQSEAIAYIDTALSLANRLNAVKP